LFWNLLCNETNAVFYNAEEKLSEMTSDSKNMMCRYFAYHLDEIA